jgi:hypothetical protein
LKTGKLHQDSAGNERMASVLEELVYLLRNNPDTIVDERNRIDGQWRFSRGRATNCLWRFSQDTGNTEFGTDRTDASDYATGETQRREFRYNDFKQPESRNFSLVFSMS